MGNTNLENKVKFKIEEVKNIFVNASHEISKNPELQNQEFFAQELLTKTLSEQGFSIEKDIAGHKTGFIAKKGSGNAPRICFLAEYDALPDIGHGCGHNIIGTLSSLAAVGLAEVIEETGGTVLVYGTPAEEGGDDGSAKGSFTDQGLFNEIDVAMLMHPKSRNLLTTKSLAVKCYAFEFFGQTAHASSTPENGINALDAMILFYNGINALRQQTTTDVRIHGVITEGGKAPNVIPDYTKAKFYVRAATRGAAAKVLERVIKVAEGAAIATGCTFKATKFNNDVDDTVRTPEFDEIFKQNAKKLGLEFETLEKDTIGSSDVGNVSYAIPVIQPCLKVTNEDLLLHTIEFTRACVTDYADASLVEGAKALAFTGLDLVLNEEKLEHIKLAHKHWLDDVVGEC